MGIKKKQTKKNSRRFPNKNLFKFKFAKYKSVVFFRNNRFLIFMAIKNIIQLFNFQNINQICVGKKTALSVYIHLSSFT